MSFDPDLAKHYALQVWKYKQGDVVTGMIRIGDALGLYGALADAGRVTADELATSLGFSERFLVEWLYSQAAAGLVEYEDGEFWMIEEARSVLVNEDSLLFAGGAMAPPLNPEHFDLILESIRTGKGFTYGEMGDEVATDMDRSAGAWQRTFLPTVVIPQIAGIPEKLAEGGRVLEIGCGSGVAIEAMASAFPNSTFLGLDPSAAAVAMAEARLAEAPNAQVRAMAAEDLAADDGPFDLAIALDCMHDMARPDIVAERVRSAIADSGAWLIKDIRSAGTYEGNQRNPVLAMMYGFSVASCLPSSLSVPDGLGLGTLGLDPETLTAMMEAAGFASTSILEADDPTHFYYEIRP
jgi:2-polyprenyl-3-methyl-5-hydroxy-6-metoxy-1,4-benzoquinol methylase